MPKGRAGFSFSLRGEDLWGDYAVLSKDQLGRRTNLLEPEKSLMLRKATQQIAHKGGETFRDGIGRIQRASRLDRRGYAGGY